MNSFFIDETTYSLESRLSLVNASGNVRFLLENFNHGIAQLAEAVNMSLFARTHIAGITYYATQSKAFIFLNIRLDFLAFGF